MDLISLPGQVAKPKSSYSDSMKVSTVWQIWRYENHDKWLESKILGDYEKHSFKNSIIHGNLLLQQGAANIWNAVTGLAVTTDYSNANARVGVSTNTTAAAATDTELGGASETYVGMDTSFPALSGTGNVTAEFQSVFTSALGNHAWESFGVDNGSTASLLMNRVVSSQGTKASGQTWTVKVSLTAS